MLSFYLVMLAALLLIVGFWNRVSDFKTAYLQSLLFLEVINWYDGIVIDKVWVGRSKFWVLPGTEDIPFVQTWGQVLKKRCILTLIWVVGAAVVAGLVVLIFLDSLGKDSCAVTIFSERKDEGHERIFP